MVALSKSISNSDTSAVEFVIEMLAGDPTYAINFDRVQWDNQINRYVIIEYLLCDEKQFTRGITPYTSHPNRYFHKNTQKFIALWQIAQALNAVLYLANYSKKGTKYQDEVLLMEVVKVDSNYSPPVITKDIKLSRQGFSNWLRELNRRGQQ